MGKDKKRERSSSPSSSGDSSSDDRQHKKHKHKDKDKDKKKKKSKSKHKKDKKDKKDDMVSKAKEFLKNTLAGRQTGAGGDAGPGPVPSGGGGRALPPTLPTKDRITEHDYFAKNVEYRAWLLEDRKLFFNELTSEQTHDLFEDFVGLWNAERLDPKYYKGEVAPPTRLTTHVWNIKGAAPRPAAPLLDPTKRKAHEREFVEEMIGPKATGREAVAEKRLARREDAKARDSSPDRAAVPGGGDMYGGEDSFAATKAWEAKRAEQQRSRQAGRGPSAAAVAAFQAKEEAQMAQFRALAAQGPIVIQKRT